MLSLMSALILALVGCATAYSDGAPEEACETMTPEHEFNPRPGGNDLFGISVEGNGDDAFTGRFLILYSS